MAYEIVWEPEGVVNQFSGAVPGWEFIESVKNVQSDFRFDEARYVINDFSAVTKHGLTEDVLTEYAALLFGAYASHPNCRVVFVTTDTALAAQVINIPAVVGLASYQTEIRPTLAEARDWLDAQPQLFLMSNVMGFRVS
ncbi:MAG: hypothetical protein WAW48_02630 [Azonexus sp.]